MPKLLLPLVVLALAGGGVGAYFWLTSGGGVEESAVAQPTETPTAEPTPTPTASTLPSVTPTATAEPTAPKDWATYEAGVALGFTLRYPREWHVAPEGGRIASWDLATWNVPEYPPGGVLVDFDRVPKDQLEPRPKDATDTAPGGALGWERTQIDGPDAVWGKAHVLLVERGGYGYLIFGAFAEENADETVFAQILASFRFTD